ncbi:anaphase-promoting complex subunit 11 RING-H2 finger-domain-containing protein [Podospora didyma]|uniref:Anaphase-promoting complex subunit 11 n=1 Tax=Podospora didyma TaxID=330526 RepID=A0AAE0N282_9PEZI|nr:anaphase-promoting complex subunit 11 RING-H2 finger-domain-containing protein [Podospora didyma]
MKVKIKKWNAVATWRWDLPEDDVCGICQVHFDGTCPACKYPGDDCSLLSGKCGHNFHMHCILEWIKQDSAKGQCPMCRQKFEWSEQLNETSIDTTQGPPEAQALGQGQEDGEAEGGREVRGTRTRGYLEAQAGTQE